MIPALNNLGNLNLIIGELTEKYSFQIQMFDVSVAFKYRGGDFLLVCEDFGTRFDHSFFACAFFFFFNV